MDHLTKEQRHKNMVANKSRGTKIELLLGHMMWNAGIRYRKNDKTLPGTPDFSIRGSKVAVFCDGEFWHGHDWEERKHDIKTNRQFWYSKIERNIKRDETVTQQLNDMGWKVFRFWENDIRHEPERCLNEVASYIHGIKSSIMSPTRTYGSACHDMNIYGPHSYNRDGSIMSVNDQMAVVSHYLQNHGHNSASPYAGIADGLIEDIREDKEGVTAVCEEDVRRTLFTRTFSAPFTPPLHTLFTFADLFTGIGGIRIAMQQCGGRCVFASEWDGNAARQYFANFGEAPFGDIVREDIKQYIPDDFDMLCASLPLQTFALSHRRDLLEKIRGTLFAEVAEIVSRKRPPVIIIECPGEQYTSSYGSSINTILAVLRKELGYSVPEPKIFDSADYGLPLQRKYLFIVGFVNEDKAAAFEFPGLTDNTATLTDIIEKRPVSAKYYLKQKTADKALFKVSEHNSKATTGTNNYITDTRTTDMLPSTRILNTINRQGIRRLTPREYARIYGYPDNYRINVTDRTAYSLFKNSSSVAVVREIIKRIILCMDFKKQKFTYGKP